jgi:hypothetical protein
MTNKRSLEWYHANKDRIDKEKRAEYMKEYRLKNLHKWNRTPEQRAKINENRRKKYAENAEYREKQKQKAKEYQQSHPDIRKSQRLKKFGITLDEFNKLFEIQNGKCAICGYSDLSDKNFFPVVDHTHETGKVRGLLCMNCNMGLGKFKDNPEFLRSAINYLRRNSDG